MFENLKRAVISNGWKFPEGEIKRWYAGSANGGGSVSSGNYSANWDNWTG